MRRKDEIAWCLFLGGSREGMDPLPKFYWLYKILYNWWLNILPVLMFDKSDSFFYQCSSTYHLLCNTGSDKVIVRTTTVPPTKLVLSDGMQLVSSSLLHKPCHSITFANLLAYYVDLRQLSAYHWGTCFWLAYPKITLSRNKNFTAGTLIVLDPF